jgi:hypothetical protein
LSSHYFYCFTEGFNIFIEILVLGPKVITPKILKSMINSVMVPKVNWHDPVWLVFLYPVEKEVVAVLEACERTTLKSMATKVGSS